MPKKYYNKVAIGTYAAILLSTALFIVQFVYEGWEQKGAEPMMSPLGIGASIIALVAIILFVLNLRRVELTHEQWLEIRDKRRPDLEHLRDSIGEYIKYTMQLTKPTKNPALYRAESYYTGTKPSALLLFQKTVLNNTEYLRIKTDDENLSDIRVELENLVSRLSSDKLRKMLYQLYRRENIARSYQIFLKIYRTQYNPVPEIEKHILQDDSVSDLAKYLKKIYDHINTMERGKDLD